MGLIPGSLVGEIPHAVQWVGGGVDKENTLVQQCSTNEGQMSYLVILLKCRFKFPGGVDALGPKITHFE